MDPSISHSVFEAETEDLMGSSFNIIMLEESIRASLKPQVTCLFCFFFSAFLSQLGGTVGFYYILLFQQGSHELCAATDRDFCYVLKKISPFFVLIFCLCLYC